MSIGFGAGITVVTNSLPDATVNVAYDAYTLDALDYTPPISWAIVAGALPAGMVMNAGGVVSGTPTAVGTFSVTVEATDGIPATKQKVLTIRVVPDIGNIRRFQMEGVVETGTSVVPIEGSSGTSAMRRKLERLLARALGAQINERFMLDAVDLQIRNFNAMPLQSIDDALNALLGLVSGYASGLDNTTGLPVITPDVNDALNIVGLAPIAVTKNIGLNRMEVSYTGAALSAPFTMLPAPSGDITGVADTAAFVALLAGATQDWLVSPQDATSNPYYINADLGNPIGTRRYRVTGKGPAGFRMVGVGGQITWHEVEFFENAELVDIRANNPAGSPVRYDNCRVKNTLAVAVCGEGGISRSARFHRSLIEIDHADGCLFDGSLGATQQEMLDSILLKGPAGKTTIVTSAVPVAMTYIMLNGNSIRTVDAALDVSAVDPVLATIVLGTNSWNSLLLGGTIVRGTTPTTLGGRYAEAVQAFGNIVSAQW